MGDRSALCGLEVSPWMGSLMALRMGQIIGLRKGVGADGKQAGGCGEWRRLTRISGLLFLDPGPTIVSWGFFSLSGQGCCHEALLGSDP